MWEVNELNARRFADEPELIGSHPRVANQSRVACSGQKSAGKVPAHAQPETRYRFFRSLRFNLTFNKVYTCEL